MPHDREQVDVGMVLDDVWDGEQIRHLLPVTLGSAALITGWRRLWSPAGIRWRTLGVMRRKESWALLDRFTGSGHPDPRYACRGPDERT